MNTKTLSCALVLFFASSAAALPQEPAPAESPQERIYLPSARVGESEQSERRPEHLGREGGLDLENPRYADGFGLTRLGDELIGAGPGYEASFRSDAVTFTPALGEAAPRTERLRFELESVARRDAPTRGFATDQVEPVGEHGGVTVRYPRGEYVETYEVRREGIKQSFVFHALPQGRGDLVVRLRTQTDLPLAHAAAGEVRFETDGIGGVRIGEVVGIDALDRRVNGSLRYLDGMLELSLPARFVDAAALPLVLDPLIGGIVQPGIAAFDEYHPDVAFDASNQEYLVVYARRLSSQDASIRGRRLTAAGTEIPGLLTIRSSVRTANVWPRVTNSTETNLFVVIWHEDSNSLSWQTNFDVVVSTVRAGSGAIWPAVTVAGTNQAESRPDIAGHVTPGANWVTAVWANDSTRYLEAAEIILYPNGLPSPQTRQLLVRPSQFVTPRISQSGGSTRRNMVVYADGLQVNALVLDDDAQIVSGPRQLSSFGAEPSVDGDGTHWVVAYTLRTGGERDVACRAVSLLSNTTNMTVGPEVVIEGDVNDREEQPAVTWLGESALVAFKDWDGTRYNLYAKSLNPFDCTSCEGQFRVASSSRNEGEAAIASQFGAGGTIDEVLLVWQAERGDRDVQVRRFRADDGEVINTGTGCPGPSIATAGCAVGGNGNFAFLLKGAPRGSLGLLNLGGAVTATRTCGWSCWIRVARGSVIGTAGVDSNGNAAVSMPLTTAVSGTTMFAQWTVITLGPGCGFVLSNGLEIRIR